MSHVGTIWLRDIQTSSAELHHDDSVHQADNPPESQHDGSVHPADDLAESHHDNNVHSADDLQEVHHNWNVYLAGDLPEPHWDDNVRLADDLPETLYDGNIHLADDPPKIYHDGIVYLSEDPPPPYTMSIDPPSTSAVKLSRYGPQSVSSPMRTSLKQLNMYLLAIMTYSLDVDFATIHQALGTDKGVPFNRDRGVRSILTDEEDKELFRLSTIIADMHMKYKSNKWNLVLDCDKKAIIEAVVGPLSDRHIEHTAYILDLIWTYSE